MTNKELEEAFMENIKYGQRYLKRMHDANPDKEEGAFKYTIRDTLEPVELPDGTNVCKRKFLRILGKICKREGAKLTHNSRRLRVTMTGGRK